MNIKLFGAGDRNRTCNLLITNQLLCQLSYTSKIMPFRALTVPLIGLPKKDEVFFWEKEQPANGAPLSGLPKKIA